MVSAPDLAAAAQRAAAAMRAAEDELNAADGKLGDGDTGQTMRRLAEAVAAAAGAEPEADLGAVLRHMGMAGMATTGSSLGTLVSLGLVEMGKALKGRAAVTPAELAEAIAGAEAAMLARGNGELGAKTALDVLHAVRVQLEAEPDHPGRIGAVAHATLEDFRGRPSRLGRARMYGERSIGVDDPGMLAFVKLTQAILAGED